ncbi:MAG: protein translocase subunit SecD [Candidatus Paceibacterota bacterium]|jgi:protein-export membrane protein SecD
MFKSLSTRTKVRLAVIAIFIITFLAANFDFPNAWDKTADDLNKALPNGVFGREFRHFYNKPFKLGLDLQGGAHLVYEADMKNIAAADQDQALVGVRDVIERRVNLFGVAEPLVQVDMSGGNHRLIVELAGVNDISQAIQMIGQTPYLEFKEERPVAERDKILEAQKEGQRLTEDPYFIQTGLDGRMLKNSEVRFDQTTGQPEILFQLNDEGAKLFAQITKRNVGKRVAIYLDGVPISVPTVNEEIPSGEARITGKFTVAEAQELVRSLNAGALPVPIKIISQQTVGASLGKISLDKSLRAGILGFILIALFMILYYRLPGVLATIALAVYAALLLAVFKLVPVTLTLPGIAGFILTLGMAVDANVLIFARMKEERELGKDLDRSITEGFHRAWNSIRDSNISSLITAAILYWVGVSFVRGFALTFSIGVLASMFTAITFTRQLLILVAETRLKNIHWLWSVKKHD